jgi:lysophospholipase L1-like esterase
MMAFMKKLLFLLIMLLANSIMHSQTNALNYTNLEKYSEDNKKLSQKPKVVFLGNSITEGWAKAMPDFFASNNYVGRGISGQTSTQALLRFRQDVIQLAPKKVVINIGTNDVAENSGPYSQDFTVGNIESMIQLAKQNKIQPIVSSVLPAAQFRWRPEVKDGASKIVALNAALKALAAKHKVAYLDYHTPLKNDQNGLSKDLAEDGVHPTKKCFEIMVELAQKALK